MESHPALSDVAAKLINSKDRYEAHDALRPRIAELCEDRDFLHETLRNVFDDPIHLQTADYLRIPFHHSGDVIITINLFCPIRDGAKDITLDNIHHHGWRLLTTGVVSGDGYNTINFVRKSHENRDGDKVLLEVEEIYKHVPGHVRFIDSDTAHVVFHSGTLCSTLAVWSADKVIATQSIKRALTNFPKLRSFAVKAIHKVGLNEALGLNPVKGLYYHPEGGRIVETPPDYSKPFDGTREEILPTWFKFFEQVGFNDPDYWLAKKDTAPPEALPLIDQLVERESIADIGIWGNMRRRFSKTQILQALDHSVPAEGRTGSGA